MKTSALEAPAVPGIRVSLRRDRISWAADFLLIGGIFVAVLAFGGTAPAYFAAAQLLVLAAAGLSIAVRDDWPPRVARASGRAGLALTAALTGLVLLQLCPLPARLLSGLGAGENPASGLSRISVQPYATRAHLLLLITCFAAFYMARRAGRGRQGKKRLVFALLGLGIFEAFYGLAQYLGGWQKIFAYTKKYDLEEATGTYINRNHFAGFLEMVLPLAVALVLYEYEKLGRNGSRTKGKIRGWAAQNGLQRIAFWLCVSGVLCAALIFSRSRMGIIATAASLALVFLLAETGKFKRKTALVVAAGFVGLSIGLAMWIGPGPVAVRFETIGQEYAADYSRLAIWRDTGTLIRRHPLLGTGLGTFPVAYTRVQTAFLGQFVNHAHNDYLELASDLGVPAALALFGGIVFVLVRIARGLPLGRGNFERSVAIGCAGGIAAILLHSLTDFNLYIPANALLFSVILGAGLSPSSAASFSTDANEQRGVAVPSSSPGYREAVLRSRAR